MGSTNVQLADQIESWLKQQGIASRDYRTGQPEGQDDQILYWGDGMGPQPTAEQLQAASSAVQAARSEAEEVAAYVDAMTALFDKAAQERRYDDRITCALRAGYPGPFQAEGQAFAMWMDACNKQGYDTLAAVKSGAAVKPSVDDFIAALPKLTWPT